MALSWTASAGTLQMSGLGDGQGWNDGSYYTGYVTLRYQGIDYAALCIDALHETVGTMWDALYIPLTDTADLSVAMQDYFGISDPAVYLPKLYADMTGWEQLSAVDLTEPENNTIQHDVWAQFDPGAFTDTGLAQLVQSDPPNINDFGLLVGANYASGGTLEQAFLVDPEADETPEPASLALAGAGLALLLFRRRRQF